MKKSKAGKVSMKMAKTPKKYIFTRMKPTVKKAKKKPAKRLKIDSTFEQAIKSAFTPKSEKPKK